MGIQFRLDRSGRRARRSAWLVIALAIILMTALLSVGGLAVWSKLRGAPPARLPSPTPVLSTPTRVPSTATVAATDARPIATLVLVRASAPETATALPTNTAAMPTSTAAPPTYTAAPPASTSAPAALAAPPPGAPTPTAEPASASHSIPNTGFGAAAALVPVAILGAAVLFARGARRRR